MKKRRLFLVLGALAVYFLLLCLLIAAESAAPGDAGASITSLGQALWYSLVTMTTVGYGDAYPVTFFGRIIGVLFLLLSAGALTAFISLGVGWVTGSGLPKLRIRRAGQRRHGSCRQYSVGDPRRPVPLWRSRCHLPC